MAPDTGFEPVTKWLTATYSTAELIRNVVLTSLLSGGIIVKFFLHVKSFSLFFLKNFHLEGKNLYYLLVLLLLCRFLQAV